MCTFVASLDLSAGVSNETNAISLSGRYKDALNASRFAWFFELDDWVESINKSKASGAGLLIAMELIVSSASLTVFCASFGYPTKILAGCDNQLVINEFWKRSSHTWVGRWQEQ